MHIICPALTVSSNFFMKNMKYETFLFYIRQPFTSHQRKIVFYGSDSLPEMFKKTKYLLSLATFNHLYHRYKVGAKHSKRIFNLTKKQFRKLTSSICFYCGISPYRLCNIKQKGKFISREPYLYNGIDRINSKEGYIISNCVPCCFTCNRMKNTFDSDIFMKKVKEIYHHQKSKTSRKG